MPLGRNLFIEATVDLHNAAWLALTVTILAVSLACLAEVQVSTPFTFITEIPSPEPTIGISNCSTVNYGPDCLDIPVSRVIDGDSFVSAKARIRLFGMDQPGARGTVLQRGYRTAQGACWRYFEGRARPQGRGPIRPDYSMSTPNVANALTKRWSEEDWPWP